MPKNGIRWDRNFGWRARVGLIMPATQTVTEPLYYSLAPTGVSFHTSRLAITGSGPGAIAETETLVPRAVHELAQARVNCIAYLCVTGGLVRGLAGERKFCREIERETGIPVASALLSAVEALKVLKIRRLLVTGPYPNEHNELERALFTKNGFEVLGVHGLGITDGFGFGQVAPREVYKFCKRVWDPRADGLFVACAAFNAMPAIERLERELGVPVVTAHAAVLWKVLRLIKIVEPVSGYGTLLRDHL